MRILNRNENHSLDCIEIFLTRDEAQELRDRISGLLNNASAHHIHLDTDEKNGRFERELIIAIYDMNNLSEFDERSRKLIVEEV